MDSATAEKVLDDLNELRLKPKRTFRNTEADIKQLKEECAMYQKYSAELAHETPTWGNTTTTLDLLKVEFEILSEKYNKVNERCNELEKEIKAQQTQVEVHNAMAENNIDEVLSNMQCELKEKEQAHSSCEKDIVVQQKAELSKYEAEFKSILREYNEKLKNAMTKNLQMNTEIAALRRKLE